jgi:hypothetical protein
MDSVDRMSIVVLGPLSETVLALDDICCVTVFYKIRLANSDIASCDEKASCHAQLICTSLHRASKRTPLNLLFPA